MCQLNKLKKKLHLKKLVDFLDLYAHVVFYHSLESEKKRHLSFLENNRLLEQGLQKDMLFLVKSGRLRKWSNEKWNKQLNNHNKKDKTVLLQKLLSQVTRGGAMGSTFLIGCDSLESMQKCIAKNVTLSQVDYVCLGGIYDQHYIDNIKCSQLAQINPERASLETITALNHTSKLLRDNLMITLCNLISLFTLHLSRSSLDR